MRLYRIADARFAPERGTGARLYGGRWNSQGREMIYACATYSGAVLEKLVHANGRMPKHQVCVIFEVPDAVRVQTLEAADVPDWDAEDCRASQRAGDAWLAAGTCAVLLVPSVVFPIERNALLNPAHADFTRITIASIEPARWDARLFQRS